LFIITPAQSGRRIMTPTRRRVWRLLSLCVLALVTSSIAWLIARPTLVPIGTYRLEARMRGKGRPAVVFEAGIEGGFAPYEALQDRIAEQTQTLTYERAGLGRSGAGPQAPTAEQTARELRVLLGVAGIQPPVILVCYAAGCLYTRVFAHDFPAETAGIVFVDPMSEGFYARMESSNPSAWRAAEAKMPAGAQRELAALPATLAEANKAWPLPQVPCVVITALKPLGQWPFKSRPDMDEWLKENQGLVARLPDVTHIVLPQATHDSILQSDQVSKAILQMLETVRGAGG
jgi:pimeloyl-ACP methyl ester carboxylesterase